MAWMAAQFLKGGRSYLPVRVRIVDNRWRKADTFFDTSYKMAFNNHHDIKYELDCTTLNHGRQVLCLNQREAEYLLEGLLLNTAINISPEDKVELMKLLSFESKEEVIEYLKVHQEKLLKNKKNSLEKQKANWRAKD
jgi:hypothetical protein